MMLDLDFVLTLTLIVAVPAAIGGALMGDRLVGWVLARGIR
jgi:hypothetical protein